MQSNPLTLEGIEAVIYDMDGVLIDSEPVWKIAMEEVFTTVGANLTKKDFELTVGLRLDEVIAFWYRFAPWEGPGPEEVLNQILFRMEELLTKDGKPLEGVMESLEYFKSRGLKIGLATSSYEILIEAVLKTLDIKDYFLITHSAEREQYGKPHPAVYLTAAEKLGVHPLNCLVIEDSMNGIVAGKSARMKVVCIPEKTHAPNPRLILADHLFESLSEMISHLDQ